MGAKRINTEQFIKLAQAVHGLRYDYSETVYVADKKKVRIICPVHGAFEQLPINHKRGFRCGECRYDKNGKQRRELAAARFIKKAKSIHGDLYDYSQANYINSETPLLIICRTHGAFEQSPDSHFAKRGCQKCGRERTAASRVSNTEDFVKSAHLAHGLRYDYSQVAYKNDHSKVKIGCSVHGWFLQVAGYHKCGKGCRKCGFEKLAIASSKDWIERAEGRPAILYFIRLYQGNEEFFKVGVTLSSVKKRYSDKTKMGGYRHEEIATYTSTNAAAVYEWEQSIIESFAHLKYVPQYRFSGATECFSSCEEILELFPL